MKIVHIVIEKSVRLSEEEYEKACKEDGIHFITSPFKKVPLEEPIYIVEMSSKELQLVSFYLELEQRKPIVNIELNTELSGEKK